jgi:hypothetical protein
MIRVCSLPAAHTLCARTIPLSAVQNNEKSPSAFAISIACAPIFHHSRLNHRGGKTSPRIAPPTNKNYAPHFINYAEKISDQKKNSLFLYSLVTVSISDFYKRQDRLEIITKKPHFFYTTLFRNRQKI